MSYSYKYLKFTKALDDLETEVKGALFLEICKSNTISKHVNQKCLIVDVCDYTELVFLNNKLVFLDSSGLQYNIDSDCTLADLIDILHTL